MIDVIIPTRNAPLALSFCLAYYWLNGHDDRRVSSVSIFDNCSMATDVHTILTGMGGSDFRSRNLSTPKTQHAQIFRNEKNVGVWASVNRGLALARSEFVFVLTSDVLLGPDVLHALLAVLRNRPELDVVGPMVRNGLENLPWLSESPIFTCDTDDTTYNGACWLMRRNLLDRVGYFDPQFYVCYGDTDYMQRLQDAGGKFGVSESIRCVHLDKQSRQADHTVDQDNEVEIRDAERFHRKWIHRPDVLARHPVPNELLYAMQKERYWKHDVVGV